MRMRNRDRVVALIAGIQFLVAAAAQSGDVPDLPGPWAVGHTEFSIVDAGRDDRELALDLWYPVDAADATGALTFYSLLGPIGLTSSTALEGVPVAGSVRPLIVFSHGFGGINIQSIRLMEHLASHGFIVVAPEHTGNTQFDPSSPDPEADRYPDIAFVIDEMEVLNTTGGHAFFDRVDTSNVGVAGHSLGGMTAQFMAAGHPPFGPDLRVKAIMPVAASSSRLTDAELAGITVPTLLMVGTLDGLQTETIRAFGLIGSEFLYRVDVVGANHTHFANVCDIGNALLDLGIAIESWPAIGAGALVPIYAATCVPPAFSIEEATRIQNLYAAAHFRRHLQGETYYDPYLSQAYALARETDTNFFGGDVPRADPMLCYRAKTTPKTEKFAPVGTELVDALESSSSEVKKTLGLCVPADRDGEGVVDDCTHLKTYKLKGPKHAKVSGIVMSDAFGTLTLDSLNPDRLLVPAHQNSGSPASEPGDSRDHYKCYRVKPTRGTPKFPKGVQVNVSDAFEDRLYDLKRPLRLCVPVDRDGIAIVNPGDHLLCYKAKRAKGEAKHAAIKGQLHTSDAWGAERLDTIVEDALCVPATRVQ